MLARLQKWQFKKKYLSYLEQLQINHYKNSNHASARIEYPHFWGGTHFDVYQKKTLPLLNNQFLTYISNTKLHRHTTLLWDTDGASIRLALRRGSLNPQALTSKTIK